MDSNNDDKKDVITPALDEVENPAEKVLGESEKTLEPLSYEQEQKMVYKAQEAQLKDANTKVAKTAVKSAATYFGGPVGSQAADAINKTEAANHMYDKVSSAINRASTFNPLMRGMQKKLNQAEEDGTLDAADRAVDIAGTMGASKMGTTVGTQITKTEQQATSNIKRKAGAKKVSGALGDAGEDKASNDSLEGGSSAKKAEEAAKDVIPNKSVAVDPKDKKEKKKGNGFNFEFLTKHPMLIIVLIVSGLFFLLFIILMSILLGGGGAEYAEGAFLDERFDFTATTISLTNSYQNESDKVVLHNVSFEDYIKGVAYAEMYQNLDGLKKDDMVKVFKAYMVVARSLALSFGKYTNETKQMELQSGPKGIPYCDIYNGCDIVSSGGLNTYVTTRYNGSFKGSKVSSMTEASPEVLDALNEAYSESRYLILVPKDMNEMLTAYTYPNPPYSQNIKSSWISKAPTTKEFEKLIIENSNYSGYKIYNLEDYAVRYNYSNNTSFWWPIGSKKADSSGIHSGKPLSTRITSPYGYRYHPISGNYKFHSGIDIGAACKTPIIATRSGTVKTAKYSNSYGYYIDIDHGNGITSRYAHIIEGGIMVAVGQTVTQGQQIAMVGTTGASTGCHLHFEIRNNGTTLSPTDYVNASNARPQATVRSAGEGIKGNNNMQSVCLTLKNVGFSDNAVAGLMTNMKSESGFRLSALGDGGTSYGLCQWHNGRYANLRNYCGSNINSVGCQIDYLVYELKHSYVGTYNYLRTNNSAYDQAIYFCLNFERPANKHATCPRRANNDSAAFLRYVTNGCQ